MSKKSKKTETKYYKVVTQYLESASAVKCEPDLAIQYVQNEWVYPKLQGTKLFVFDDFWAAKDFCIMGQRYIYECEVQNPTPSRNYRLFCSFGTLGIWDRLRKAHKLRQQKKKFTHITSDACFIRLHTVMVDAVKLTKRLENYYVPTN